MPPDDTENPPRAAAGAAAPSRPTLAGPTLAGPTLAGPTLAGPALAGPALTETGAAAKAAREARSAAALRENLRRRKVQARARAAPPGGDTPEGG